MPAPDGVCRESSNCSNIKQIEDQSSSDKYSGHDEEINGASSEKLRDEVNFKY